ncbi:AEC family transporter [Microbacterium sp. GXF6406]
MVNVLSGFAIILAVIAGGYLIGRINLIGTQGAAALSKLTFTVFTPCLLITVLAEADVEGLFSITLLTSALAALSCAALFALIARTILRRTASETVIGALSSSYVNGGYLGLALSVYILGDAAYSAPIVLLQVMFLAPIALTILDVAASGEARVARILLQPVTNPIVIASAIGVLIALTGIELPSAVMEPFALVGAAAVPAVLIGFGISLHGQRVLAPGSNRRDVLIASAIKILVMPLAAWAIGSAFALPSDVLRAVVVMAALPVAQNVLNYAQRYDASVVLARDTIFITTIGSIPVLLFASVIL